MPEIPYSVVLHKMSLYDRAPKQFLAPNSLSGSTLSIDAVGYDE